MSKIDRLDHRTATFTAYQGGLEVGDGKYVTNAREIPTSRLSLSQIRTFKLYQEWQRSKKKKGDVRIPSLDELPFIYAGIQIHKLIELLCIEYRLDVLPKHGIARQPDVFTPFLPNGEARKAHQHIFLRALPETLRRLAAGGEYPSYYYQAMVDFEQWMGIQDFFIKEPKRRDSPRANILDLYKESGMFPLGVREKIWDGKGKRGAKLAERLEGVLSQAKSILAAGKAIDEDPYHSDAVFETPVTLHMSIWDESIMSLCWVQPDQVLFFDDDHILVRDIKSEAELDRIKEYDIFDWLELLLTAVAGKVIVDQALNPRLSTAIEKPLYQELNISELMELAEGVRVEFQIPGVNDEHDLIKKVDVTPTAEQKIQALELLAYIISYLGEETGKQDFYSFANSRDREGKELSPKARLETERQLQRLLFHS